MIPLRDENPTKSLSFVTLAIILVNILVFIYELTLTSQIQDKIYQFAVVPYNLVHRFNLQSVLPLITSLFFHASPMHLIGNMLYLWIFANNIEDRLGHLRFIFFYIACGIVASLGQVITALDSKLPMIGASGAVSGILGAYLILYPRAKVLVLVPLFYIWRIVKVEAKWFLVFWICLQFFYGSTSFVLLSAGERGGIAWFAHIAGFFAGIIFLGLFLRRKRYIYQRPA